MIAREKGGWNWKKGEARMERKFPMNKKLSLRIAYYILSRTILAPLNLHFCFLIPPPPPAFEKPSPFLLFLLLIGPSALL